MPDDVLLFRIRSAYRAQAALISCACGGMLFAVGTGLILPYALNAAWLPALFGLPLCLLFLGRIRHMRSLSLYPSSRIRLFFLFLAALLCMLTLTGTLCALAGHTLLVGSPFVFCAGVTLAALAGSALCGSTAVEHMAFALRFSLPVLLILLVLSPLFSSGSRYLFPLLGPGVSPLTRCIPLALPAVSPVCLLMLPPQSVCRLTDARHADTLPRFRFFALRIAVGFLTGTLLLLVLILCNPHEVISTQYAWGQRMLIIGGDLQHAGFSGALLSAFLCLGLLLGAGGCLCGACRALGTAFPRLKPLHADLLLPVLLSAIVLTLTAHLGYRVIFACALLSPLPVLPVLLPMRKRTPPRKEPI